MLDFHFTAFKFWLLVQQTSVRSLGTENRFLYLLVSLQDSKAYFHLLEQIAPDGSNEDLPKIEVDMSGVFVSYLYETL